MKNNFFNKYLLILFQLNILTYFFNLNKKIKFQINNYLEDLFLTNNVLLKKKIISLMYSEVLVQNLQIKYLTIFKSTKSLDDNILQIILEDLTKLSTLSVINNQQIQVVHNSKRSNIKKLPKIKSYYSGYFFFRSMVRSFNKGGQLQKSLQKILTGILETRRILTTKQPKKVKLSFLFSLILKRVNPLYFNRRFNLGRKTFIMPSPLYKKKKRLFASRWLKKALKKKREIFLKKFPQEILSILKNTGETLKYKEENKAIAALNIGNLTRKFRKKKRK